MKVVCCVANDDNLSMGHSKIAGFFCHDSVFFLFCCYSEISFFIQSIYVFLLCTKYRINVITDVMWLPQLNYHFPMIVAPFDKTHYSSTLADL